MLSFLGKEGRNEEAHDATVFRDNCADLIYLIYEAFWQYLDTVNAKSRFHYLHLSSFNYHKLPGSMTLKSSYITVPLQGGHVLFNEERFKKVAM